MKTAAAAVVLMIVLAAPSSSGQQLGVSVTGGERFDLAGFPNYTLGFRFNVTSAFTVDALGVWDADSDGLLFSHQVGLWDAGGNLLASTTVGAGTSGTLLGGFRMQTITPFTLAIGSGYRVAVEYLEHPGDQLLQAATITSGPGIQYMSSAFFAAPTMHDPTNDDNTGGYFGGNFYGEVATTAPEPGALALFGSGLVGVLGLIRKRRPK